MTPEELASFEPLIMAEPGARCFLCGRFIAPGEQCLRVPETCEDTERRDNGQPYAAIPAHGRCIEKVP